MINDGKGDHYLSQCDLRVVPDVDAFPLELWVRFIPNREDNVRRNGGTALVALPLERDFCAGLPTGPHIDCQHFVLFLVGLAVGAHHLASDLHLLHTTPEHLLEG